MHNKKKYLLLLISILIAISAIGLLKQKPSYWGDELLGGLFFTGASSVSEFITVQGSIGPEVAPIYPLLLYFCTNYFGIPSDSFRYFSVMCSLLSIVFIFITISRVANIVSGFFVAISVALIPIHLWYGLLLRPHALAFLLGIISFYCFSLWYRSNNESTKLVFILFIVNTILIFTHYTFLWIPLSECLFLILNRKRSKPSLIFLCVNSILMGMVVFYLGFIVRTNNIEFTPEKGIFRLFFTTLGLMDFEVPSLTSWGVYIQPLFFVHNPMPLWLSFSLEMTPLIIIYGGNFFISTLLLYLLFKKLFYIFKDKSLPTDINFYLLFFGVILPICFSIIQVITGKNILMARYFYLSFVCKIALLYIFITQLERKSLRRVLLIITLFFFIHQYFLYRTCAPYTDWDSCAKYLQGESTAKDVIITGRFEEAITLKQVNPSLQRIPILYTNSIKSAIDGISFLQNKYPEANIYLVYSMQWNPNIPCILQKELEYHGIIFHEKVFLAFEGIVCYTVASKIERLKNTDSNTLYRCDKEYSWELEKKTRKDKMNDILEKSGKDKTDREMLLEKLVFPDGVVGLNTIPQLLVQFIAMGKSDEIKTLCEHFRSQVIWANLSLIFLYTKEGQLEKAEQALIELRKRNFYLANLVKPIWERYVKGDYGELLQYCQQLKKAGVPFAYVVDTVIRVTEANKTQEILQLGLFPFNKEAEMLLCR